MTRVKKKGEYKKKDAPLTIKDLKNEIKACDEHIRLAKNRIMVHSALREKYVSQLFQQMHGMIIGEQYDLEINGKVLRGKLLGIHKQYIGPRVGYETGFKMEVPFKNRTVIRVVLPGQIIGLQGIPLEEIQANFDLIIQPMDMVSPKK